MRSRVAIASVFFGALVLLYLLFQLHLPVTGSGESREVEIRKGTSFREAVTVLAEHGLIKDRRAPTRSLCQAGTSFRDG
jgi:cell division protein YceG involved in septum cleavage